MWYSLIVTTIHLCFSLSPNLRIPLFLLLSLPFKKVGIFPCFSSEGILIWVTKLGVSQSTSLKCFLGYVEDGSYWTKDLNNESKYLGEEMFKITSTEGSTGDNSDLKTSAGAPSSSRKQGK